MIYYYVKNDVFFFSSKGRKTEIFLLHSKHKELLLKHLLLCHPRWESHKHRYLKKIFFLYLLTNYI